MPRYHFDLVDHTTVEDKGGQILADDIFASGVADELALRVARQIKSLTARLAALENARR
jgi:hypothetical protein